ncbi:MAG: nicotinate-nucleotide diphosphorylase (carboxylating), partial [Acutalibacteraceae bacterium]|nr:nicotinate-nucleotide diphosphorylase (carboxylating) [Acutalibacteraceae bacterium]
MKLNKFYVDDIIKTAINEDINYIDTSADLVFSDDDRTTAYFVAKTDGVLCGIDVAFRVFELLDDT